MLPTPKRVVQHKLALRGPLARACILLHKMPVATETFSLNSVSRGSRRTRPNGSVRVIEARLGGSMAGRVEYCQRGGSLTSRADEVLWTGHAGPAVNWAAVDRRETRKDAQVGYEIWANVPHTLSLKAKQRIGQRVADHLSQKFLVPVHAALHTASKEGDARNEHFHFPFPARDLAGTKLTALQKKTTSSAIVAELRGFYQEVVNAELVAAKSKDRLDLRSRATRGLSEACVHIPKREFQRARRREISSPQYDLNQSIIAQRAAAAVVANATAKRDTARAKRVAQARDDARRELLDAGTKILGALIDRRSRNGTAVRETLGRLETVRARGPRARRMEDQRPGFTRDAAPDRDARLAAGDDAPGRELRGGRADALPAHASHTDGLGVAGTASPEPASTSTRKTDVGQPRADDGTRPGTGRTGSRVEETPGSDPGRGPANDGGRPTGSGGRGNADGGRDARDPGTATRPGWGRADAGPGTGGSGRADAEPTAATPPRSLLTQIGRWITRAEKREVQQAAEAQAAALWQKQQEEAAAQRATDEKARAEKAAEEKKIRILAQAEARLAAVATSDLPLVSFTAGTDATTRHHAQREDFLRAWNDRRIEVVPLCTWRGEPTEEVMPLNAVNFWELQPVDVPTLAAYLQPDESQQQQRSSSMRR